MEEKDLEVYKKKIAELTGEEKVNRDLHLKKLADGTLAGPSIGYPELDKPWLGLYDDKEITEDIPKKTIYEFLKQCNDSKKNRVLLDYFNKKITRDELFKNVDNVALALVKKYNIKPGDVVSVCLPTIPETYYIFLALNKIGAIAKMIDPRINEERIRDVIGDDSKLVFCIDAFNEKFNNATIEKKVPVVSVSGAESLNKIKKFVYKKKAKIIKIDRFISWSDFANVDIKYSENIKSVEYSPNTPAAIICTSGTTGTPKMVSLTNDNINYIAYAQRKNVPDMCPDDKYLVIMPPFIAYGLVCGICCPLSTQQRMILIPKFDPKDFPKLVSKYKPNHMLGVPSFFEDLIKSKKINKMDLSFIKYCIVGGDKLNPETEKRINNFFKEHNVKNNIVKGYGMTELSSAAFSNHDNDNNKVGSVGTPYIKNNVMIVDDESNSLTYNNIGNILVSTPSMMKEYINNAEEQNKVIVEDEFGKKWVKTGDLGRVDSQGNLFIEGRSKRMIVRPDGHNVFPSVIENLLSTHPAVENVCVVGVSSSDYENGKIPTAFVVLKEEFYNKEDLIREELIKMSNEKLPPRDVALSYNFISSLPMTPVGKIDIKALENYDAERGKIK